jgi:hypothetical protein
MPEREKRKHQRRALSMNITCEIGTPFPTDEAVDAQTLNVSTDGVCIKTEKALESGRVVMLKCPDLVKDMPIPRLAEVRWVATDKGVYRMGLRFRS